jgi:uncharacterized protein (DUF1015 family)
MVKIKPFAGIRPPKELAAEVSSRPYDVLNSQEAKAEATERSLLHIIKPEIDFDPIADEHDEKVYKKAVENFKTYIASQVLAENVTLIDKAEDGAQPIEIDDIQTFIKIQKM